MSIRLFTNYGKRKEKALWFGHVFGRSWFSFNRKTVECQSRNGNELGKKIWFLTETDT